MQAPGRRPGQDCEGEEHTSKNYGNYERQRTRTYGMVWGIVADGLSTVTIATTVGQSVSVVADVRQGRTGESEEDGSGGSTYS